MRDEKRTEGTALKTVAGRNERRDGLGNGARKATTKDGRTEASYEAEPPSDGDITLFLPLALAR
jgi:hypothetical protein